MDKYEFLESLGKGAQGESFLVRSKKDKKKYVLKRIECTDESECNKAFQESSTLDAFRHPYICPYKEFFVFWDSALAAMCLCVVTEYFENGTLADFLRKQREKKEMVDEELVKKWLGQLLDALMYLQKKGVVHRALKPSNIYITKEDNSFCIGDFAVSTVMKDIRTKTRSTVGMMTYMAPETLHSASTAHSDSWGVGCILLELTSCDQMSNDEVSGKLIEIKHNEKEKLLLLQNINDSYNMKLATHITKLLDKRGDWRPTALKLQEDFYIKECLFLSDSVIQERKARALADSAVRAVPKDRGVQPVVDFIIDNIMDEPCVRNGMEYLAEIIKADDATLDYNGKRIIAKAMQDFMSEWDIQAFGCIILSNVVLTAAPNDILFSADIISRIPVAMRFHNERPEVQIAAMQFLTAVAPHETCAQLIGDLGTIPDIIAALQMFLDNLDLQVAGCTALWNLTINDDNVRLCTEGQVIKEVVRALKKHKKSEVFAEAACATIISLSLEDANLDILIQEDTVRDILEVLNQHRKTSKVVYNACLALAALVEPEEECAYKVLTNITEEGQEEPGIPYILDVYELHKDDSKVVESVCVVLMELCEYDEIRAEIKHLKLQDKVLMEIHRRYKDNKDILVPCETALRKLGSKIRLQFAQES